MLNKPILKIGLMTNRRVSLCYGDKHKINAINIQNGRKESVKVLES